MWDVYLVFYGTYEEIAQRGHPNKRMAASLTFEQASALVNRLGFGHSMHPAR